MLAVGFGDGVIARMLRVKKHAKNAFFRVLVSIEARDYRLNNFFSVKPRRAPRRHLIARFKKPQRARVWGSAEVGMGNNGEFCAKIARVAVVTPRKNAPANAFADVVGGHKQRMNAF